MKLHKLISRTVLATALLGATLGGVFSGINGNVQAENIGKDGQQNSDVNGNASKPNMSQKVEQQNPQSSSGNYSNSTVPDGFLTLDSVPTLNFGNSNNNNSNVDGKSSTLTLNNTNNGTLRITDYRNLDKRGATNNQDQAGWKLNVSMGDFQNNGYKGAPLNQNDWTMHLSNNQNNYHNIDLDNGNKSDATTAAFNNQDLSPNINNSNPILDSTQQSNGSGKGYGVNEIDYNSNNDATLDIPNVPQGNYTANMNWSLSTNLTSYNTDVNHNDNNS